MLALHFDAFLLNNQVPRNPALMQKMQIIVKTQPTSMAWIQGAATMVPKQLRILRTKLLMATPAELFLRTNSVNMVVAVAWDVVLVEIATPSELVCYLQKQAWTRHQRRRALRMARQHGHRTLLPIHMLIGIKGRRHGQPICSPSYGPQAGKPACPSHRNG